MHALPRGRYARQPATLRIIESERLHRSGRLQLGTCRDDMQRRRRIRARSVTTAYVADSSDL